MEFISFRANGVASYGYLHDGGIVDLGARFGAVLPDLRSYLTALALGVVPSLPGSGVVPSLPGSGVAADYHWNEITFDPVISNPRKILCVGLNYEEHRHETGRQKSNYPVLFTRFSDTLVGHRAALQLPRISTAFDYEGELAVIIGRAGFRVPREKAFDIVAGYSCFNDASVRDWQGHTHQFTPGKNFPRTGALGPALVTHPVEGLSERKIETRLNTQVMQSAKLGDMIFSVPEIIAYVTSFTPLAPGDVIATGTPGGVGFRGKPPLFMKDGDIVEVSIDGIGHLVNDVKQEAVLE